MTHHGDTETRRRVALTDEECRCVVCGCTEERACPGGCWWIESDDLLDRCSRCEGLPPRERPILFSGDMVRAILDGRKTQTRRVIPLQWWRCLDPEEEDRELALGQCPYGFPGSRLWVRESFWRRESDGVIVYAADGALGFDESSFAHRMGIGNVPCEPCDEATLRREEFVKRPSIHMPRWASRIDLTVTRTRVERLQEITEADAIAEGVTPSGSTQWEDKCRSLFAATWDEINGPRGFTWESNPWVWVIGFERL